MKQKHLLVTGGSGFLGRALVDRLVGKGNRVRVLDNDWRGKSENLKNHGDLVEIVSGDIRDAAQVKDACRDIDAIFHLAFINGTRFFYEEPELVLDVGVTGMLNIIKGALEHQVKEFFLASSSEVYQTPPTIPTDEKAPLSVPDPLNPRYSYGGGKIVSELLALNYGRKHFKRMVVFRPHNVYGPAMGAEHVIPELTLRMLDLVEKEKERPLPFPIQGTGKETRAFIFIDDFIDGLMVLLEKGQHQNIYHIGTQSEERIENIVQLIAKALAVEVTVQRSAPAAGGTPRRCPDISKMKALGFKPHISLEKGIERTVAWYRESRLQEQEKKK